MRTNPFLWLTIFLILFSYACKKNEDNVGQKDLTGWKILIDIKSRESWSYSSTPIRFQESQMENNILCGANRARLTWYKVSSDFVYQNSYTPKYLTDADRRNDLVRDVDENEIFTFEIVRSNTLQVRLSVLNLAYYPEERGVYNFDTKATTYTQGINQNGKLNAPKTRWGGIQRKILQNDFDALNIKHLEFWLMDPFVENQNSTGTMYFNLGNIDEDFCKDRKLAYENNIFADIPYETSAFGRIWKDKPLYHTSFAPNTHDNIYQNKQDIGLDGLTSKEEQSFFSDYLSYIKLNCTDAVYSETLQDPSNDNYHYFFGTDYDAQQLSILDRYKNYNGLEGNTPAIVDDHSYWGGNSLTPNVEDINQNGILDTENNYWEYKVAIDKSQMEVGKNYIDEVRTTINNYNGRLTTWYHFKIPIYEYESMVGNVNIKNINTYRLYLTDFEKPVVLRITEMSYVGYIR